MISAVQVSQLASATLQATLEAYAEAEETQIMLLHAQCEETCQKGREICEEVDKTSEGSKVTIAAKQ